jgi:hypothetical protein
MHHFELTPLLTDADAVESSEGGLDPLGTESLADKLAVKLVPGVRERQQHPRFLTATAVSLSLCAEFGDEVLARDGVSQPWLVFEWYVVEGLVRTRGLTPKDIRGLPGREKAARAIADGVPLSTKRYLKTPSVFGFHGIYRALALTLGIQHGERLGERGCELLALWAKERGLGGFVGTAGGPGKHFREQIGEALRLGLEKGAVARTKAWAGWEFFSKHLAPYEFGRREARFLSGLLLDNTEDLRREVLESLISEAGSRLWQGEISSRRYSERLFHEALGRRASANLHRLLRAIDAYERFARLVQDAFDDCLYEMSRRGGKVSLVQLGRLDSVKRASRGLRQTSAEVMDRLDPFGLTLPFQQLFDSLAEGGTGTQWLERLLEHHRKTQRQKPPDGKMPWFEGDESGYIIRPLYRRDKPAPHDGRYVHLYRTNSLWSFASDLKMFRK